ncbi:MAG: hypothetical protein WCY92_01990 [Novosphingobium sp.]
MRPGLSAMLLALACAGLPGDAAAAERVVLPAREITVADLALLDDGQRTRLGPLAIAVIPAGRSHLELDSATRAKLLRRRVPGQALRLRYGGKVRFEVSEASQAGHGARQCLTLRHDLDAGAYLQPETVAPALCRADADPLPLLFDRRVNAPRLSAPLAAGTYLGPLTVRGGPVIAPGTELRHVARQGPVIIERRVNALQPSRMGQAVFVRAQDGAIFASRLAAPVEGAGE